MRAAARGTGVHRALSVQVLAWMCAFVLAACGGGGDSTSQPATSGQPQAATNAGAGSTQLAATANAVPISIDPGPSNDVNVPFVSVTVCVPGSNNCQTVDHVLVDTGSVGLRLFAAALNPALALPPETTANGALVHQCMQFADGYTWGGVRVADVRMAGELAGATPIQIMGDPAAPAAPSDCTSTGPNINDVRTFGANGVIGLGVFIEDCGPACAQNANVGVYYACQFNCASTTVPLAQQVQNPVARFANDNNGVVVTLPPVPAAGTTVLGGTLVFGIGTQVNNGLGSAAVLTADPNSGYFTTLYKGQTLNDSFIDSGSNGIFFRDAEIPHCRKSFYCPTSTLNLSATNVGRNGAQSTVAFTVANADQVFAAHPDFAVFPGLASSNPDSSSFDWGLPFFFGRTVFTAIETRQTPAGRGPYFAY
ncbi:DUF3443 domain-containing protein [Oxalobacteraceae bacterium OM1]|nr:DUF3443 domain-containing protein [Oxalobacteraceae bacterium OM1]